VTFDNRLARPLRSQIEVSYRGTSVFRSTTFLGFLAPIRAPGTTGSVCVANLSGGPTATVILYTVSGAGNGAIIRLIHPTASGRYVLTSSGTMALRPWLTVGRVHGSLLFLTGDLRFDELFTDGAGSMSPVRIEQFRQGALVDVSRQFPRLLAAQAAHLVRLTHTHWFHVSGVWAFIGELNSWTADECRLGNGARAWQVAQGEVQWGRFRRFFAQANPHYLAELRQDLVRWGYC
jgi:hypothetical protein